MKCEACKGWGGQGTVGKVHEKEGNWRMCMIDIFGDSANKNRKPMFRWKVTHGDMGGAKGNILTHKDFGCINYNPKFEEID